MTSGALRRLFVIVVTLVAFVASSRVALAQSANISNAASPQRLDANGKTVAKRATNLTPEGVSLQDCVDDQSIELLGTLDATAVVANSTIQIWATIVGGDCTQQAARTGAGVATCWRAYDSNVVLSTALDVKLPVRKIMSGATPAGVPGLDATATVCGKVDLTNIDVQFIYFAPGQSGAGGTKLANVTISVDTVGPEPPSGLRVLPGNTRIQVNWDNISGGSDEGGTATTGGNTALTGVKVYCDKAGAATTSTPAEPVCHDEPIDAGVDEAGNAIDAGTTQVCVDGGSTTNTTSGCTSPNFSNADGSPLYPTKDFDDKYECGEYVGNTGTSATATKVGGQPLQNGTQYAVAVAGTDGFGNVGRLSTPKCETPDETTDFWTDYRNAGGGAGDGCATTGDAPIGSTAAVGLGAVAALSSILRRRRERRRHQNARPREGEGSGR